MKHYTNISEQWGERVSVTIEDYIAQAETFGIDSSTIKARDYGICVGDVVVAESDEARTIIDNLQSAWGSDDDDTERILSSLDGREWAGGETLDVIAYAGIIDNGHSDMMAGHNGYWIATDDGMISYVTNGDSTWCEWDEEAADAIGLEWGEFAESAKANKIS